jgi:hypothetical protein
MTHIVKFGEPGVTIEQCIAEAIGLASVCWMDKPQGLFDSQLAEEIVKDTMENVRAYLAECNARRIQMEPMRPGQEKVMTPPRVGWEMMRVPERHRDTPGYDDKPTINKAAVPRKVKDNPQA